MYWAFSVSAYFSTLGLPPGCGIGGSEGSVGDSGGFPRGGQVLLPFRLVSSMVPWAVMPAFQTWCDYERTTFLTALRHKDAIKERKQSKAMCSGDTCPHRTSLQMWTGASPSATIWIGVGTWWPLPQATLRFATACAYFASLFLPGFLIKDQAFI